MRVKLYDIVYDTDGDDIDLPIEIVTTLDEMGCDVNEDADEFIKEHGADYISDVTGWLVNSFCYEIVDKPND